MIAQTPAPQEDDDKTVKRLAEAQRETIESLGEADRGLFIFHHAILAWLDWELWSRIVGIPDRHFRPHADQTVTVKTAEPRHPITADLPDAYTIEDETYTMADADPADGNTIVLITEHDPSMGTLAWTRTHGKARVFCLQSGHDDLAWSNPNLRTVVQRGIQWCANRI